MPLFAVRQRAVQRSTDPLPKIASLAQNVPTSQNDECTSPGSRGPELAGCFNLGPEKGNGKCAGLFRHSGRPYWGLVCSCCFQQRQAPNGAVTADPAIAGREIMEGRGDTLATVAADTLDTVAAVMETTSETEATILGHTGTTHKRLSARIRGTATGLTITCRTSIHVRRGRTKDTATREQGLPRATTAPRLPFMLLGDALAESRNTTGQHRHGDREQPSGRRFDSGQGRRWHGSEFRASRQPGPRQRN